ncbi:MAG: hypothetical protein WBJ84_09985 [Bacteroidales bacterium]
MKGNLLIIKDGVRSSEIKQFELLGSEWTVDGGELTASLKMRRSFICEKYRPVLNKMFRIEG